MLTDVLVLTHHGTTTLVARRSEQDGVTGQAGKKRATDTESIAEPTKGMRLFIFADGHMFSGQAHCFRGGVICVQSWGDLLLLLSTRDTAYML